MTRKPKTLDKIKEMINLKLNIQESGKVKKFLGVYYKWGCGAKGLYNNMSMEGGITKFVEDYEKYSGSDVQVQKTPGAPGMTLSKIEL